MPGAGQHAVIGRKMLPVMPVRSVQHAPTITHGVLPVCEPEAMNIDAVYRLRKHPLRALHLLLEFLVQRFALPVRCMPDM